MNDFKFTPNIKLKIRQYTTVEKETRAHQKVTCRMLLELNLRGL